MSSAAHPSKHPGRGNKQNKIQPEHLLFSSPLAPFPWCYGPELTSRHFLAWAIDHKIELVHIQPGKPTQNAYVESFHGRLREECLRLSWFENLFDARRKIAAWRHDYNHQRPHSSLNYRTPAEFACLTSYGKDAGAARFENALGVSNFPTASTATG